jgi:HEAT repeat protein
MTQWLCQRKLLLLCCLVSVASAATAACLTRDTWLAWYYLRGLRHASDVDRDLWIRRVNSLGDDVAVPHLIGLLQEDNPAVCEKARVALAAWCENRDGKDAPVLGQVSRAFEHLSFAGQQAAFTLYAARLHQDASSAVIESVLKPVQAGVQSSCKDVRASAYELLVVLVHRDENKEHFSLYRELVRRGVKEEDPLLRARAVCTAAVPEIGLQDRVAPLLYDPAAEVRRAAILAVGSASTVVHDDDLLPWLNDSDPEVCRLCELALEGRGIPRDGIRLGRMVTHPDIAVRLQAIHQLLHQSERDPTEWFRRLSHDAAPSVRVAAIRAACRVHVDLRDRMEEMVQTDESQTVRQVVAYYFAFIL